MAGRAEEEVNGGAPPVLEAGAVVTPSTQYTFLREKNLNLTTNIFLISISSVKHFAIPTKIN